MSLKLQWDAERVQSIMQEHGVSTRRELVFRLKDQPYAIRKTKLYRLFNESWEGDADADAMVALSLAFDVPVGLLIRQPVQKGAS